MFFIRRDIRMGRWAQRHFLQQQQLINDYIDWAWAQYESPPQ